MVVVEREEVYKKAIGKWGDKAQLEMAQEEATELALAVRKFVRNPSSETLEHIAEEVADVEIMIEQLKFMYPSLVESVKEQKEFKLNRLKSRVSPEEKEVTK